MEKSEFEIRFEAAQTGAQDLGLSACVTRELLGFPLAELGDTCAREPAAEALEADDADCFVADLESRRLPFQCRDAVRAKKIEDLDLLLLVKIMVAENHRHGNGGATQVM